MAPRPTDTQINSEKPRFNGIIRPLKREDLPALRRISEMWLVDPPANKIAADEVDKDLSDLEGSLYGNGKRFLVAETPEGQVIGMMGLSPVKDALKPYVTTENPIELVIAYVDQEHRGGRGVGTALINALQEIAQTSGSTEILLESGPRHIKTGHGFYDNQKFERVGVLKDFYGEGADSVVWQKIF